MKSVGSIGKITKAMKMVSAAKMKGDLRRLAAGKDFGH
jgi:F-type H+-transporting ATPase subunit gamma